MNLSSSTPGFVIWEIPRISRTTWMWRCLKLLFRRHIRIAWQYARLLRSTLLKQNFISAYTFLLRRTFSAPAFSSLWDPHLISTVKANCLGTYPEEWFSDRAAAREWMQLHLIAKLRDIWAIDDYLRNCSESTLMYLVCVQLPLLRRCSSSNDFNVIAIMI